MPNPPPIAGISLVIRSIEEGEATTIQNFEALVSKVAPPPDSDLMKFAAACKRIIIDENLLEHEMCLTWPDWPTFLATWDKGWPPQRPFTQRNVIKTAATDVHVAQLDVQTTNPVCLYKCLACSRAPS